MSKTPRMGFTAKLKNSKKSGTVNRAKGFALRNEAKQAMIESVDNSQPFQFSPFGLPQLFNPDGGQELSQWDTLFDNLRFYLISNNRQLISQCIAELGLVRTICDVPVSDALRGGIVIKSKELDEDDIKKLQRFMLFNKDLQTIGRAMSKMRGFGGAGVVLICDDQNPESKLDVSKLTMKSNVKFKAADLWELFWDVQDTGMYDPSIAIENVKTYRYYGKNVDASRVTPLIGIEAPSFIRPRLRGWGLSELEILIRGINQFLKSNNLAFEVLDEFKVDVYKIKNLINSLMTVTGQNNVRQRVALANQIKNFQGALVMDSEDDYDHKQLSFAGIAEMMVQFRIQIASDMRIPITKLFGISATGFNSGEDDIEVYNGMVESEIRGKMLVPTTFVTSIRCQQLFGFVPDDLEVEFKPLRMLSAEQEETVKTAQFGRLLAAADSNRISTAQFLDACNSANLLVKPIDLTDEQLSMDSLDKPEPAVDSDGNPDADKDKKPPKVAIKKAASTAKATPEAKNSMPKIVRVAKPGDPGYMVFNDDEFREGEHPRDQKGEFTAGGGGGGATGTGGTGEKSGQQKKKIKPFKGFKQTTEPAREGSRTTSVDQIIGKGSGFGALSKVPYKSPKSSTCNAVGFVAFGKASGKAQEELNTTLQSSEVVLSNIGIKFKTPIDFTCQSISGMKNTAAEYQHRSAVKNPGIEIKVNVGLAKSFLHEIGHAIDYALSTRSGRPSSDTYAGRAASSTPLDPAIDKMHKELKDIVSKSIYYTKAASRFSRYLNEPTEIFARAFEVFSYQKALDLVEAGEIPAEFTENFKPDIFKTPNEKLLEIKKATEQLATDANKVLRTSMAETDLVKKAELKKQGDELWEKYKQGFEDFKKITKEQGQWLQVDKEKQAEYIEKITKVMTELFSKDTIRNMIAKHFEGGKVQNPGHVDEGLWAKAKKAAEKSGARSWALVTHIYKRMGGKFK